MTGFPVLPLVSGQLSPAVALPAGRGPAHCAAFRARRTGCKQAVLGAGKGCAVMGPRRRDFHGSRTGGADGGELEKTCPEPNKEQLRFEKFSRC